MKQFLIIIFCCFCEIIMAQSDLIQKWEQQALRRSSSWSNYTNAATAANNQTYTSLYIKERYVASFDNAGTCHSKITELTQLARQIIPNSSSSSSSSQNSAGTQLKGDAYNGLLGMSGVSGAGADAKWKDIEKNVGNSLNKHLANSRANEKNDLLAKVERLCSCRSETNRNYDPNAKPYGNNDLFSSSGNNPSDLFSDAGTQYENVFDAPSARDRTFTPQANQPSVSLNFDNLGDYVPNNGVVMADRSGKSILEHLNNQPSLPLTKSEALTIRKKPAPVIVTTKKEREKQSLIKSWINLGIDAGEFVSGFFITATSTVGVLATANVNLYAELSRYITNPEDYPMGWDGTKKIFTNALSSTGQAVLLSNGSQYSKTIKSIDHLNTAKDAYKLGYKIGETGQETSHYLATEDK